MNKALEDLLHAYAPVTPREWNHALTEVVQGIALLGFWRSGFFEQAAFYGGTALRIFHSLRRFSEDLDFTLVDESSTVRLDRVLSSIETELSAWGLTELFGPLVGLEDEWRTQGASDAEIELVAFGFDHVRRHRVAVAPGFWPSEPEELLEETDESRVFRDGMGRTMKLPKRRATLPLPLDYPVHDEADWARIKPRYRFDRARFTDGWAGEARTARENGALIVADVPGGYDEIRQLMGDEEACASFYTRPELIRDMLATFEALNRAILSRIVAEATVDQLGIHEDFAGKSGPLVGPNIIDEFIGPYYHAAWREVSSVGGPPVGSRAGAQAELYQLDSDGNITRSD